MRRRRGHRRVVGILLALLAVGVPPGLALTDSLEPQLRSGIESQHDPGRCDLHHDHAACVQLVHSFGLRPLDGAKFPAPAPPTGEILRTAEAKAPLRPAATTRHPRAPPIPLG